jgi:protein with PEP-CTERM/exosortase system signal
MISPSKGTLAIWLFVALVCVSPASASVIQTIGDGSAVTTVEASAEFESLASLFGPYPYIEDTLAFSRVNLSDNNNGCGYAGCAGHTGFVGFSGNYMYGVGGGYLLIQTTGSQFFTGLEFRAGTGFTSGTGVWEAYRLGALVGSGTFAAPSLVNVGFSDPLGFDELRYSGGAPAFDSVLAQFDGTQAVPDSGFSLFLLGTALLGLNEIRRRS